MKGVNLQNKKPKLFLTMTFTAFKKVFSDIKGKPWYELLPLPLKA